MLKLVPVLLTLVFLTNALGGEPKDQTLLLVRALTSSNWSWENSDSGRKSVEDIQFYRGGIARNPFFTATWEATGPRSFLLRNTNRGTGRDGTVAYLVFDADFTHFVGFDFNGRTTVEAFRREAVDQQRVAP